MPRIVQRNFQFRSIAVNDACSFNEARFEVDFTNSQVMDGEVVSIKAATASVQNPWNSEIPIRFYEKSFPNHVQGKYNDKLSWQIAGKVKNARKNG